jgi:hypothetical protein
MLKKGLVSTALGYWLTVIYRFQKKKNRVFQTGKTVRKIDLPAGGRLENPVFDVNIFASAKQLIEV